MASGVFPAAPFFLEPFLEPFFLPMVGKAARRPALVVNTGNDSAGGRETTENQSTSIVALPSSSHLGTGNSSITIPVPHRKLIPGNVFFSPKKKPSCLRPNSNCCRTVGVLYFVLGDIAKLSTLRTKQPRNPADQSTLPSALPTTGAASTPIRALGRTAGTPA